MEPNLQTSQQPSDTQPLPKAPPAAPPVHKGHSILKIVIIIVACIVGLLIAVGVVIILMVGSAFNSLGKTCDSSRTKAYSAAQQAKPAFNRLVIIPGVLSTQASEQKQAGDCIDSEPTAWLTRSVTVNETAEQAISQVTASLQSQGYTGPTHDHGINTASSPCKYNGGLTYSNKAQQGVTITMNCDDSRVTDGNWAPLPVTEIDVQTSFVGNG